MENYLSPSQFFDYGQAVFARRPNHRLHFLLLGVLTILYLGYANWHIVWGWELAHYQQVWAVNKPKHYAYTYQIGCNCRIGGPGPQSSEVNGEHITALTDLENPLTIEELFAFATKAIDEKADKLQIDYDKQLGYIKQISVDFRVEVYHDEFGVTVQDFEIISSNE